MCSNDSNVSRVHSELAALGFADIFRCNHHNEIRAAQFSRTVSRIVKLSNVCILITAYDIIPRFYKVEWFRLYSVMHHDRRHESTSQNTRTMNGLSIMVDIIGLNELNEMVMQWTAKINTHSRTWSECKCVHC